MPLSWFFLLQIPLYDEQDLEGLDVADQLLKLANSHNSAIDNAETALLELIELPKAPFGKYTLYSLIIVEFMLEPKHGF